MKISTLAQAADMPVMTAMAPPPMITWTGCYIGGNVGEA
jgi:hypothetical protein